MVQRLRARWRQRVFDDVETRLSSYDRLLLAALARHWMRYQRRWWFVEDVGRVWVIGE